MGNKEKIIELKGVEKIFDGQTAVEKMDLYIRKGEFVTFFINISFFDLFKF